MEQAGQPGWTGWDGCESDHDAIPPSLAAAIVDEKCLLVGRERRQKIKPGQEAEGRRGDAAMHGFPLHQLQLRHATHARVAERT